VEFRKKEDLAMRIHWFSITIFQDPKKRELLWQEYFSALGVLVSVGHGGRGYREIDQALLGAKVYHDPVQLTKDGASHYHVEIPGEACDALLPSVFSTLLAELTGCGVRYNVKRLDLAFDDVPFSPQEFLEAAKSDDMVSLAKREKIKINQSPFQLTDDGKQEGTTTVYLGRNSSQRMVRVYDRRGPVRLEFQMRDDRAQAVALDVFSKPYPDWEITAKSHLRQYVDFIDIDWWDLFVDMVVRADLKISSARKVTFAKLEGWLDKQVSVALSVWFDVQGEVAQAEFFEMLRKARRRDRSRYAAVLELAI